MTNDKLEKRIEETVALALPEDLQDVADAISALGDDISPFDLPELTIPAGGGLAWEVATLTGTDSVKEVTGCILDVQSVRQYYAGEFTGEAVPPDCASPDGFTGLGNPGGDCADCPLAKWGSAPNGGQACSQRKHVLFLTPHNSLPYLINVPPSSLKPFKQYLLQLAGNRMKPWQALTALTLVKAQNKGGITYSQLAPAFVGAVPPDKREAAESYRDAIRGMITQRITEAPQAPTPDPAAIAIDDYTTGE